MKLLPIDFKIVSGRMLSNASTCKSAPSVGVLDKNVRTPTPLEDSYNSGDSSGDKAKCAESDRKNEIISLEFLK